MEGRCHQFQDDSCVYESVVRLDESGEEQQGVEREQRTKKKTTCLVQGTLICSDTFISHTKPDPSLALACPLSRRLFSRLCCRPLGAPEGVEGDHALLVD